MKNKSIIFLRFLICILIITPIIIGPNYVRAGWLEDTLDDIAQSPEFGVTPESVYGYFGEIRYTPQLRTVKFPIELQGPHLHTSPCGFDIFFGSFSAFRPEYLVSLAQGVLAAAPAYAFNLALSSLCTRCQALMQELSDLAQKINNLNLNSCQILQLADPWLKQKLGIKGDKGALDGVVGKLESAVEWVDQNVVEKLESFIGKDNEGTTSFSELAAHFFAPVENSNNGFSFWLKVLYINGLCSQRPKIGITGSCELGACDVFVVCDSWNSNITHNHLLRVVFQNPKEYAAFLRYIAGDYYFEADFSKQGNCESVRDIISCFTSWIGQGSCDACDPASLMKANKLTQPTWVSKLESIIASDKKGDSISKLGSLSFNCATNGGTVTLTLKEMTTESGNFILLKDIAEAGGGSAAYNADARQVRCERKTASSPCSGASDVETCIQNIVSNFETKLRITATSATNQNNQSIPLDNRIKALAHVLGYLRMLALLESTSLKMYFVHKDIRPKIIEAAGKAYLSGLHIEYARKGIQLLDNTMPVIKAAKGFYDDPKMCKQCSDVINWMHTARKHLMWYLELFTAYALHDLNRIDTLLRDAIDRAKSGYLALLKEGAIESGDKEGSE